MKDHNTTFIMQTICGIQGAKDAGHKWYKSLALIFTNDLGMVPAMINKGIFHWKHKFYTTYLVLVTDNILLALSSPLLFEIIQDTFNTYFAYTTSSASRFQLLNYRMIQSNIGTSIDQYNRIR